MVSVAVLPLPPQKDLKPIPSDEIEVKTQGGHGKGGQHQNVTDSAVRMVHIPTKINVFINGRDQHANRREALRILTARVNEHHQSKEKKEYNQHRKRQMGGGNRGDKVRTYNFIKHRVVDHRLGNKTTKIKRVMKGELGLLF
jgi:peptide chain release factor 1